MRLATRTFQRHGPRDLFIDAPDWRGEVLRYGAAMVTVATVFIAVAVPLGHDRSTEDASEVGTALMIDLPPAVLPSNGKADAVDGPPQTAARAAAMAEPREAADRPEPIQTPDPRQTEVPPPPLQPEPPVALAQRQAMAPPPKPAEAPGSTAREERAPSGSDSPTRTDSDGDAQTRPHASAHAITQWQLSLMRRLQQVKRAFVRQARISGTVRIAFEIDDRGALVTERIARSSGSTALDQAASILVKAAAPFPPPPPGAGRDATSFIVPIVFRH